MMIVIPIPALAAGVLASVLYYALLNQVIVGLTAPFLPLFCLALAGMAYGRAGITVASLSCIPLMLIFLDGYQALLLITTQIIPVTIFIRQSMVATVDTDAGEIRWLSATDAMTMVSVYVAVFYATIIGTDSGLYRQIKEDMKQNIQQGLGSIDNADVAAQVETLINELPHAMMAMEYWFLAITLLLLGLAAQWGLETFGRSRRPRLHLASSPPPDFVLAGLAVAGALNFTQMPPLIKAGQAAGIVLLFPYFLTGLGSIHHWLRQYQNTPLWLGIFYIFFAFTLWPALLITAYGLVKHLSEYSFSSPDRRS